MLCLHPWVVSILYKAADSTPFAHPLPNSLGPPIVGPFSKSGVGGPTIQKVPVFPLRQVARPAQMLVAGRVEIGRHGEARDVELASIVHGLGELAFEQTALDRRNGEAGEDRDDGDHDE